ncbi:hypothetical protein ACWGMW_29875 [Streptomyces albidoflavus]
MAGARPYAPRPGTLPTTSFAREQAGFTRKSVPTRLRESGAPGQMVSLPGGELRWRLPDGTELTPGQAAKKFLGD